MTATASQEKQVSQLVAAFCRALAQPIPETQRIGWALESALAVARDTTRSEDDRLKELRTRIQIMLD